MRIVPQADSMCQQLASFDLKGPSQSHLYFVYIRKFGYYILFEAYRNEAKYSENIKNNYAYFQEHNLQ